MCVSPIFFRHYHNVLLFFKKCSKITGTCELGGRSEFPTILVLLHFGFSAWAWKTVHGLSWKLSSCCNTQQNRCKMVGVMQALDQSWTPQKSDRKDFQVFLSGKSSWLRAAAWALLRRACNLSVLSLSYNNAQCALVYETELSTLTLDGRGKSLKNDHKALEPYKYMMLLTSHSS